MANLNFILNSGQGDLKLGDVFGLEIGFYQSKRILKKFDGSPTSKEVMEMK